MTLSRAATAALLALAFGGAAAAQAPPAPASATAAPVRPPYGAPVAYADARRVLEAALAEAKSHGWRMAGAVVEPTGDLVAFGKLDDTQYGSIDIAQAKARAAALFRRATKEVSDSYAAGETRLLTLKGYVAVEGGELIVQGGRIVGAIGVSGGSAAQDGVCARAGAATVR